MGFLLESAPMDWPDAIERARYVRDHGIEQFINVFFETKGIAEDLLKYGDEIEYAVIRLCGSPDDPKRTPKISLRSPEIIQALQLFEAHGRNHGLSEADMCSWMPEYGRWMLEGVPRKPFEGLTALTKVEDHMRLRRSRLLAHLAPGEVAPTLAIFPLLGVGKFWHGGEENGPLQKEGPVAQSLFVPDEITYPHARFKTLTGNIRKRRGEKVRIARPKFVDEFTDVRSIRRDGGGSGTSVGGGSMMGGGTSYGGGGYGSGSMGGGLGSARHPRSEAEADAGKTVYADAMAFGMGCCCLQVTFQAANLGESRHLYDHCAVLSPIMMALTAASPYLRGWLTAEDVRWSVVGESVDDRTAAERGSHAMHHQVGGGLRSGDPRLAGNGTRFLRKSRYGGIDCYISQYTEGNEGEESVALADFHNDFQIEHDQQHLERLIMAGVDRPLARHVAHLFCRDPLVIFKDRVFLNDRQDVDHWENLQSTNWQSVRWKPPHPESGKKEVSSEKHVGWRVELRTMELQMTDFENAAFTVFVVLISRVLLALELNLYIPISKLEENLKTAHKMDAITKGKFWFRKDLLPREVRRRMRRRSFAERSCGGDNISPGGTPAQPQDGEGFGYNGESGHTPSSGVGGASPSRGNTPNVTFDPASAEKFSNSGSASPGRGRGYMADSRDENGFLRTVSETGTDDLYGGADDADQFDLMTVEEILLGKDCPDFADPCGSSKTDSYDDDRTRNAYTGRFITEPINSPAESDGSDNGDTPVGKSTDGKSGVNSKDLNGKLGGKGAKKNGSSNKLFNSVNESQRTEAFSNCHFPGLIPLCRTYLEFIGVDSVTYGKVNTYLEFISARARGELMTNAQYLRNFVRSHPSYKKDSRVPADCAYDLIRKATRIGQGLDACPEVLGDFEVEPCFPAANPFRNHDVFWQGESCDGEKTGLYPGEEASGTSPEARAGFGNGGGLPPDVGRGRIGSRDVSKDAGVSSSNLPNNPDLETMPLPKENNNNFNYKDSRPQPWIPFDISPEKRACLTAASNSKDPCNMPRATDGRKRTLLASYLAQAKERRDVALLHSLKVKRSELEKMQQEVVALEKDLTASVASGNDRLNPEMSAQRMVQANNLFTSRDSYRRKGAVDTDGIGMEGASSVGGGMYPEGENGSHSASSDRG